MKGKLRKSSGYKDIMSLIRQAKSVRRLNRKNIWVGNMSAMDDDELLSAFDYLEKERLEIRERMASEGLLREEDDSFFSESADKRI